MLIHKQRQILREVYTRTDEALEILNAVINEDQQNHVLGIYEKYREDKARGSVGAQTIINEIMTPPPTIMEGDRKVATSIAYILTVLFDLQDALNDLSHQAESTIMDIRDARLAREAKEPSMNTS